MLTLSLEVRGGGDFVDGAPSVEEPVDRLGIGVGLDDLLVDGELGIVDVAGERDGD